MVPILAKIGTGEGLIKKRQVHFNWRLLLQEGKYTNTELKRLLDKTIQKVIVLRYRGIECWVVELYNFLQISAGEFSKLHSFQNLNIKLLVFSCILALYIIIDGKKQKCEIVKSYIIHKLRLVKCYIIQLHKDLSYII